MKSGFKRVDAASPALRWATAATLVLVTLAHIVAVAHGVLTIDMARDLFWANAIAHGVAFPLFGPPVGSFEVLGPTWFYLAAVAVKLAPSMTVYFALLGALAATKYWLAWRVGLRWRDARFATLLVVAVAVPGIATYQWVGVGHPQMIEAAVWATALCLLRLRDRPDSRRDAVGAGLFAMLALHAHPTAIVLMPWAGLMLWWLPAAGRWRALAWALAGAMLPLLPRLAVWLFPALGQVTADNAPAVSGIGGSLTGWIAILQNLLWWQPLYVIKTYVSASAVMVAAWQVAWSLLVLLTLAGAVRALVERGLRMSLIAAIVTLIAGAAVVSLLRNHTPFYMVYALLPAFAMAAATSWYALQTAPNRWAGISVALLACGVVVAALSISAGSVHMARRGMVDSYLPLHSNMQDVATALHVESVHSVRQRDAMARWLCDRTPASGAAAPMSLHGDLAVAFDTGVGLDGQFACPARPPVLAIGGATGAWVGMPVPAWRAAGLSPTVTLQGAGASPTARVILPDAALPEVSGRTYPPRLAAMIAAARQSPWQRRVDAASGETLVVSSLLPTSPLFAVNATANGMATPALLQFANTAVFRCQSCAGERIDWQFSLRGALPETTSIVTLDAKPRPAAALPQIVVQRQMTSANTPANDHASQP